MLAPASARQGTAAVLLACVLAVLLTVLLTTVPGGLFAAETPGSSSAREVVAVALEQVVEILQDADATDSERRDRIVAIAYANFNFDTMSKLVVGRPWRKFSKEERSEFIDSFKTHLAASYGRRLGRYHDTGVEVVGEQQEQRGDVTIKSRVLGGQFDRATMDYRMRETDERWQVIDVVIEGVSLVSSFRSQFKPILAKGGAKEILSRLQDKNHVLQKEIEGEQSGAN